MKSLKISILSTLLILLSGCKDDTKRPPERSIPVLRYDTTAIDSFSPGAVSVDIAEKIRRSSKSYLDSVAAVQTRKKLDSAAAKLQREKEKEKEKEKMAEKENTDPKQPVKQPKNAEKEENATKTIPSNAGTD